MPSHSQFRPCIDIHAGAVKQIVGGSLRDGDAAALRTNFVSPHAPAHFSRLFRQHALGGGHVIMLGAGNDDAAAEALRAWPGALQVGGGVTAANAREWLARGAAKVIVTSWVFPAAALSLPRLAELSALVGRDRLVVDLSCRRRTDPVTGAPAWVVATDRWQTPTDVAIAEAPLRQIAQFCSEFLVHAADVEGLCQGIDGELVALLAQISPIPVTYAGGAHRLDDLALVSRLSGGRVDLTIGSALDIFGGDQIKLADCVRWNRTGQLPAEEDEEKQ
ncbi:Enzyme that catalyzes the fourth step in the histidine pathway [Coemansia thaxteri]|uniref:1-(5-phosphoribosyl)-5-[(5-phosphoribosylamino)methylideneamino] imidazole-4-carboxamide isomerase n=1 Tax=Coemansia thaxteri TaxID=2663907 RepID=A0A9W8BNY7_9FUNG|nr:Enzyme that catalyzes the fourth step in the histidine pathway [Coemansia thaxteri]KAJ2009550.1 Enzyme that catalyzes the fourth step in the histidine pathway [Coemansia thaxteri]KAJ2474447.1 Enzyme that catalyzes the fourth step in the histidine pathway [Coemansia sp. RSA 2322]KAJ2487713.1 Enzyme that catalyzes the fourth step in the histidine pathway [Coemansia sp. RSA 2320]